MSENSQEHNETLESFTEELNRKSTVETAVARTLKSLPIRSESDAPVADVVHHILNQFKEQNLEVHLSDRGWCLLRDRNGNPVDLKTEVQNRLLESNYVDKDSVSAAISAGQIELGAKDELRTVEQKCAFVSKYGEQAFRDLPLHRQPTFDRNPDVMTRAQYMSLRPLERAKLRLTPEQTSKVMSRK